VTGSRRERGQQLLNDLKEKKRILKMNKKASDRTLWWTRFGRCYGILV